MERLSQLLSSSPVVIYTCETEGDYAATYISENVLPLFGYKPEQFLEDPKFWANGIHPEDAPRVFAELPQLFEHGTHIHEYRFRLADGKYIWVHDELKLIKNDQGTPIEIIGYWADITERKKAEAALENQRKYLENLLRVSSTLSDSSNFDDTLSQLMNELLDIFQADRAWLLYPCDPSTEFWSVPVEATVPECPGAFSTGGNNPIDEGSASIFSDALISLEPLIYDYPEAEDIPSFAKKFNIKTQIVIALTPKNDSAWLLGMHQCSSHRSWSEDDKCLFKDISLKITDMLTQRLLLKRVEDELLLRNEAEQKISLAHDDASRANIALKESYKELEAYSYSIAHDLRAPLRSIVGFSQILLEDASDKLDSSDQQNLQRIMKAASHMAELIDDILELSRVSRSNMQFQKVNLSAICSELSETFNATDTDRVTEWRIQPDLIVNGDQRLLNLMLNNLLGNAWKFTQQKSQALIEFGLMNEDGEKVFYVRDNGAGFDMKYVDKLFGLFQRLHRADEYEGTGVGLATVQRIINRHNGWVRAEGEIGKGTTIYFSLPGNV